MTTGFNLGGKGGIRKYFLSSAKLAWDTPPMSGNMTGRALLTGGMIYVPMHDGILRVDPASGKQISKLPVVGPAGDPIGSLFTDGTRIFGLGMEYVYALQDKPPASGRIGSKSFAWRPRSASHAWLAAARAGRPRWRGR